MEILSLNSEAAHGPGSAQIRWLRREVRRRPGTCRLAFWHRPRYSASLHGDEADVQPFWDALRGHATLIVNGHDHDMQRFLPRRGLTELVAGAGGHGRYGVGAHAGLAFANASDYGALRLVLRPGPARRAGPLWPSEGVSSTAVASAAGRAERLTEPPACAGDPRALSGR